MPRFSSRHQRLAAFWWTRLDEHWTEYDRLKVALDTWSSGTSLLHPDTQPQAAESVQGILRDFWECGAWWTGLTPLNGYAWQESFQPVSLFLHGLAQSPHTSSDSQTETRAALRRLRDMAQASAFACDTVAERVMEACLELERDADARTLWEEFAWPVLETYFTAVRGTVRGLHEWLEELVDSWQVTEAEVYLLENCAPVAEPHPALWGSPELIAGTIRKKSLDLGFEGGGCALLNHSVVASLKGTATLPTRVPGPRYRYTESGTAETYGTGVTLKGHGALRRHIEANARDGGIWIVEMTGRKLNVGHGVTVICRAGELSYIDIGLGGGHQKIIGSLELADWHTKWGFDTFKVFDAGTMGPAGGPAGEGDPVTEWDVPRSNWNPGCSVQ
ncbi:hypothetical protein [Streptomyces sp. NBC_01264]|uniref:hypothetical protein n=1 Tax=Streptomyces sp. NBC_01264 TaxID=2903804 RepID=UPI002251C42D|nr:hypothetical protein [Streptomyces sp. NBC_01264]MCX4781704.1 hypothetical protein [Streptomyces sp. NBC_01264]